MVNPENEIVGFFIAWQDLKNDISVASLHWLIVSPKYQGMGLGKAKTLKQILKWLKDLYSDSAEYKMWG